MNKILYEKILEAFSSVLPITGIVLLASIFLVPLPAGTVLMFLVGAVMLIIGMGFFTMGADMAMMPMGEGIGVQLTKTSNLFIILIVSFVMGMMITIAEPDLQVLARQVPSVNPPLVLIVTVGAGVGFFLVLSVLRTLFKIRLSVLLIVSYIITFGIAFFTPDNFLPVAFDSGGVTTGPITVPFVLALGVGFASIRGDKGSQEDSFGLVSLCSVGPILSVLLLGIFYNPSGASVEAAPVAQAATSQDVALLFAEHIPGSFEEVIQALGAIVVFFILFQLISRRFKKHQIHRVGVGFVYTLIGLVVFLTGVNVGFIPVGHLLGEHLAASNFKWVLIPFSMIVGYFIVSAEPAVHVLNKQVEDISSGAIPAKTMHGGLAIGMAGALALTMIRILMHIPIMYILIPGYAAAIVLTFFVPKIFTGIAFDSGGVCSGPLTSTFLLPFAMGVTQGSGGDLMKEAFGIVAMVAMAPLIVIQIIGLIYSIKLKSLRAVHGTEDAEYAGEIIEYEGAGLYA
ncbi:MAG: DUF1538 domain-containing protein [Spirochaetaceae bacterium]|jgi:hypothetical protein|nr:DUF1538 domain-containing protein [Spirochaetaceae bacterium]